MNEIAIPPYDGPFTIPVLIDDLKDLSAESRGSSTSKFEKARGLPKKVDSPPMDFKMTRCTFFSIEAGRSKDDWYAVLRQMQIPFLLLGEVPVLHRPDLLNVSFESTGQITKLFDQIEEVQDLVVENSHIWLSNHLVHEALDSETESRVRGKVLRIGIGLFRSALSYQEALINQRQFEEECRDARVGADIEYSMTESLVFQAWSAEQIEAAKENYILQKKDGRGVLEYMGKDGNWQNG